MRKTISVQLILVEVNGILKNSQPEAIDLRKGAMITLENILHKAGNYKGFRYLVAEEVTGRPGINYVDNQPHPVIENRFENTDRTRVHYF